MISVGTNYIFKWQTVVSAQWKKKCIQKKITSITLQYKHCYWTELDQDWTDWAKDTISFCRAAVEPNQNVLLILLIDKHWHCYELNCFTTELTDASVLCLTAEIEVVS